MTTLTDSAPSVQLCEHCGDEHHYEDKCQPCDCSACQDHADDPSSNLCHECECVLHEWVSIQCLEHVDGEERVLCNDCWEECEEQARADGWRINDEDEDFPRECEECHDSFTPSWIDHRYDAVCNDCVCEHGKTQVTMDESAYRYSVLTFFKQNN